MFDEYIDEIELEYTMFLAEQELFDNLIFLGSSVYHESAGLIIVQEDFKNTIDTYIEKIVTGIQKAWNTFKEKVIENSPAKKILADVEKRLNNYKGDIEVQYWHKYDFNKLDSLKLSNYDDVLMNSCQNKEEYYTKTFPNLYTNKDKSLKENIIDQIIDTEDTHVVTVDDVSSMVDFCKRGFKERVTKIETDLKTLNTNIGVLKSKIGVTKPGEETTSTVDNETEINTAANQENSLDILTSIYESYITEAPNGQEDNNNKSTTIVKNTDAGTDNKEKKSQQKSVQHINWYLSGNADILSAKMKILRQRYLDAIKIFKAIYLPKEGEKKETNTVEVKGTTTEKKSSVNI